MKSLLGALAVAALLGLPLAAQAAAASNPTPVPQIDIKKVTCGDLLDADLLDRTATIMFVWGYEAGKNNVTVFKPPQVAQSTRKVMTYCESHRSTPLLDATEATLGLTGSK
jgi:hypothetical protein